MVLICSTDLRAHAGTYLRTGPGANNAIYALLSITRSGGGACGRFFKRSL